MKGQVETGGFQERQQLKLTDQAVAWILATCICCTRLLLMRMKTFYNTDGSYCEQQQPCNYYPSFDIKLHSAKLSIKVVF
jgi:hypothetical protein